MRGWQQWCTVGPGGWWGESWRHRSSIAACLARCQVVSVYLLKPHPPSQIRLITPPARPPPQHLPTTHHTLLGCRALQASGPAGLLGWSAVFLDISCCSMWLGW